jgi:hypothetical protein
MTTTRTTSIRTGTGAAHIGYAMFGARGPLLAPEGEGGGAAGTTTTTTTDGAAGGAAAAAGAGGTTAKTEKTFTQGELDEIVKDRLAKERASQSKQTAAKVTTTDDGEKLTMRELKAQMDAQEARRSFDRRADKLGLSEDVADDLFSLSQIQKPEDLGAWLAKKSSLYGSGATQGAQAAGAKSTTTQNGTTTETTAKIAAAAPGGAPAKVDTPTAGGLVDIWNLSLDQIVAMGPQGVRAAHEKNLAVGRQSSGAPPVPGVLRRK